MEIRHAKTKARERKNPARHESGFMKVMFTGSGGHTAGLVLPASMRNASTTELSRFFPASEFRKMNKLYLSKTYPTFDAAFAHEFTPKQKTNPIKPARNTVKPASHGVKLNVHRKAKKGDVINFPYCVEYKSPATGKWAVKAAFKTAAEAKAQAIAFHAKNPTLTVRACDYK